MTIQPPPLGCPCSARHKASSPNKGNPTRWWVVAGLVLLLTGAGYLIVGQGGNKHPASPVPAGHPGVLQAGAGSAVTASSVPVGLRIPAIHVSVSLPKLGLNADGTAQVPTKYEEPGRFKLGPVPGLPGSAVILGHVDDKKGSAVFYKLPSLRAGKKVDVIFANGAVAHFAVTTVEKYEKAQFPTEKVYGSHGTKALQLVTCGGKFDVATGHYLSNVVAYTTLVSTTPAGA